MTAWNFTSLGFEIAAPLTNSTTAAAVTTRQFFRLAQVQYASSTLAPRDVLGRSLTLNFNGGLGTIALVFNANGGGTYNFGPNSGTITRYGWLQEAYVGRLSPISYSALIPMVLRFDFQTETTGKFTGTAYANTGPFSVSGQFTLSQ